MAGYNVIRHEDNINLETERVYCGNKCGMVRTWRDMRRAHPYARMIFVQQTIHPRRVGVPITHRTLHAYTAQSFAPGEIGRTAEDRRQAACAKALIGPTTPERSA
jgi:hypothetical protein